MQRQKYLLSGSLQKEFARPWEEMRSGFQEGTRLDVREQMLGQVPPWRDLAILWDDEQFTANYYFLNWGKTDITKLTILKRKIQWHLIHTGC